MIEAQLRQRLELQQAHQDYLELKAKKLAAQKEEEERFRQQVYKKFFWQLLTLFIPDDGKVC